MGEPMNPRERTESALESPTASLPMARVAEGLVRAREGHSEGRFGGALDLRGVLTPSEVAGAVELSVAPSERFTAYATARVHRTHRTGEVGGYAGAGIRYEF